MSQDFSHQISMEQECCETEKLINQHIKEEWWLNKITNDMFLQHEQMDGQEKPSFARSQKIVELVESIDFNRNPTQTFEVLKKILFGMQRKIERLEMACGERFFQHESQDNEIEQKTEPQEAL